MAVYSHSQLQQFVRCPYCWACRYLLGQKEPSVSMALVLGLSVHNTLERLYRQVSYKKMPTLDEVEVQYGVYWEEEVEHVEDVASESESDSFRLRGVESLKWFYKEYYPFGRGVSMEIEKNIHFSLMDGNKMRGKIDRLDRKGSDVTIVDYKTSRSMSAANITRKQISLYAKGLQQEQGVRLGEMKGRVIYLDLQQEVERVITQEEMDTIETECISIIADIDQKKAEWASSQGLFADGRQLQDIFVPCPGPCCIFGCEDVS